MRVVWMDEVYIVRYMGMLHSTEVRRRREHCTCSTTKHESLTLKHRTCIQRIQFHNGCVRMGDHLCILWVDEVHVVRHRDDVQH